MKKEDIRELRKAMGTDLFLIEWIYGCYFDAEGEVRYEEVRDANKGIEEDEMNRHAEILREVLKTGLGRQVFPTPLSSQCEDILTLTESDGMPAPEELLFLRDAFKAALTAKCAYYLTVAKISYAVPAKSSDGATLEDGDSTYDALICAACPAKLSPASLGFTGVVEGISRQWVIGKPAFGFLYPSFDERSADNNEVMVRARDPENEAFSRSLFDMDIRRTPVSAKAQLEMLGQLYERLEMSMDDVLSVTETLTEENEADEKDLVEKADIQYALSRNDVDTAQFDAAYEEIVGETQLSAANTLPKKTELKSDLCTIRIETDKAQLFERRTIDGKEYILVPVEGAVIVNGTATTK